MIIPPYLKTGDKIALAAPARKIGRREVETAAAMLRSAGFEVVYSEQLFGEDHQFSGSDAQRAADMQHWISDKDVRCIMSARGGYGTMRIADMLDFSAMHTHPKWIAGYSDVTVLHSHLNKLGIATLHCTMPINFEQNAESVQTMCDALTGCALEYISENKTTVAGRAGTADAEITGGNLSLLYALKGSISEADTSGKILFIEDLDEYLYHIDRMVLSLKRAGIFSNLAGLIVGGMSDMKDNTVPFGQTAEEIIRNAVAEYNYPVVYGFPAGHEARNLALRLGTRAKLETDGVQTVLLQTSTAV
ncbi:MAG: S66 peptidase family protein [Bacteroidia bacterium]